MAEGASLRATARRLGVAHTTLQRALRRAER
ncbi:helix-turn-helix domain-containing protein [Raineyella sp. W15-4]